MENHFLLESLAVCQETQSKLIMYFMVNAAFINYFDNMTDSEISHFIKPYYIETNLTNLITVI